MQSTVKLPYFLIFLRKFNFPRKLGVLERLFGSHLKKAGVTWVKCWNGIIWKLDLGDSCHRWIVFGKYEGGGGLDFAHSVLKNGGIFIDSGANIGQWLLYLADLEGVRTFAFEPVTTQREWLLECLEKQNNWAVSVFAQGLGEKQESVDILCDGARSTVQTNWYKDKNLLKETIEISRLDQILRERCVDEIDFWKLDVEGAELAAIKGAEDYLQNHRIKNIYFECHPDSYQSVTGLLVRHGYKIWYLQDGALQPMLNPQIASTQDLIATINQAPA